jgi:hypothetical protein
MSDDVIQRSVLPIPNRRHVGLTAFDANGSVPARLPETRRVSVEAVAFKIVPMLRLARYFFMERVAG